MQNENDPEIRSEEVQEVLGTPPSWLTRWGGILAFVTLVVIAWVMYWVPYPDTISDVAIRVSSTDPPRKLVAPNSSFIAEIIKKNEDTVTAGATLVVFKNRAKFQDVLTLEIHILAVKDVNSKTDLLAFSPPKNLILGELQETFYKYMEKKEAYKSGSSRRYDNLSISELNKQIDKEENLLEFDRRRKENLGKQLELSRQNLIREQNLVNSKLSTIEKTRPLQEEVLAYERAVQGTESSIKDREITIQIIRRQIDRYKRGSGRTSNDDIASLRESFLQLRDAVEQWQNTYLISAPMDGVVYYSNPALTENQFVSKEMELMVLVPIKHTETIGRGTVKLLGSGKIKEGNPVIVKFDSYPFEEFGAVEGRVSKKGKLVSDDGTISLEVTFPKGLVTNTGRTLDASQGMVGHASIVTDQKRLIEWLAEQVKRKG